MNPQVYAVFAVVAVLTLLACMLLARRARTRRAALATELAAAHDDVAALAERLEALSAEVEQTRAAVDSARRTPEVEPYVITGLVHQDAAAGPDAASIVTAIEAGRPQWVPARPLREALVHVVSLGHGVRRALSPDVRDRILLEMKVEVRRSRRVRKAEIRAVRRYLRQQRKNAA